MDKRFGKRSTTDQLQQEFSQLQEEEGEHIQHFSSRLEGPLENFRKAFPQQYGEEQLKEWLFHRVNQQTRDSMRFLYTKETTTYDTLLAAIKEAEIEWLESKGQIRVKAATIINRSNEIEELKKKLDQLTAAMKSSSFKGAKLKSKDRKESPSGTGPNSPRAKKEDARKNLKGPATTSAGPFKPGQSNFQCNKCGGWGHGWRECASKGNVDWTRIHRELSPRKQRLSLKKSNSKLR